jgi:hypothetical protein
MNTALQAEMLLIEMKGMLETIGFVVLWGSVLALSIWIIKEYEKKDQ